MQVVESGGGLEQSAGGVGFVLRDAVLGDVLAEKLVGEGEALVKRLLGGVDEGDGDAGFGGGDEGDTETLEKHRLVVVGDIGWHEEHRTKLTIWPAPTTPSFLTSAALRAQVELKARAPVGSFLTRVLASILRYGYTAKVNKQTDAMAGRQTERRKQMKKKWKTRLENANATMRRCEVVRFG